MTWQVGWWVKGWAPTGLVRTSHSPAPYSGVSGSGYALIILELPKDNSHDITVGSFFLCHFFSFLWCNMCCTGHNSMLVFILFQKKWILAYNCHDWSGCNGTVYNGFFLPIQYIHTVYLAQKPDTYRCICSAVTGSVFVRRLRLFFGTVDQLKFLNLCIGDPLPSLTWFRDQTTPMQTEVDRYALVLCRQFLFATGGEVFHSFLSFYCIQTTFTLPVH